MNNYKTKYLYIAEVPIDKKTGGSLLLHRIFSGLGFFPTEVRVAFTKNESSENSVQLPFGFLKHSRFSAIYMDVCFRVLWIVPVMKLWLRRYRPEKVITVSHGVGYKIAYLYSKMMNLPLVVFHHDLYSYTFSMRENRKGQIMRWFMKTIFQVERNFYISSPMQINYNAVGDLVLPFREAGYENTWRVSADRTFDKKPLKFFIAGSVYAQGTIDVIFNLCEALHATKDVLVVYSNLNEDDIQQRRPPNISLNKILPVDEVRSIIKEQADCLVLIQNFGEDERVAHELNFPSKLVDYTLFGLPILIIAPEYSSSVGWARSESTEFAIVVTDSSAPSIAKSLKKIITDLGHRKKMGENAVVVGNKYFSADQYIKLISRFLP